MLRFRTDDHIKWMTFISANALPSIVLQPSQPQLVSDVFEWTQEEVK